jgi:hypothetical protein
VAGSNGTTYTLVISGTFTDCVKSGIVGTLLAGMIAQSKGCAGGESALYRDAAKDQFDITVLTFEDSGDALTIMNGLASDYTDFEVGTLLPPSDSGLKQLSAKSGMVQEFDAAGNRVGIYMAQWANGAASDYQHLTDLLTPLQDAIGKTLLSDALGD